MHERLELSGGQQGAGAFTDDGRAASGATTPKVRTRTHTLPPATATVAWTLT